MVSNKIILKDGTEIANGVCSKSSTGSLLVRIPGSDMAGALMQFSDKENISIIVCYNYGYKYTFTGYETINLVQHFQDQDYVELWLKGENVHSETECMIPDVYMPKGL